MIVPQTAKPKYDVSEDANAVTVKAKNVTAVVDKATGAVVFYDADGKLQFTTLFGGIEVK
jgi:alpha-D-xyloside xylohydrolase